MRLMDAQHGGNAACGSARRSWALAQRPGRPARGPSSSTRTRATPPGRTTAHAAVETEPMSSLRPAGKRMEDMANRQDLTRAVDLAIAGDWKSAHAIVQQDA